MNKKNGPWTIKKQENIYKDEFISITVDQVTNPAGDPGTYATVQMKSGVAILPMDAEGNIYLTRQFRYAVGKESIEVISGGIDEGEEPLKAAKREAKEELGIEAEDWEEFGFFHLETSIIKGPVYLFVIKNLHFTDTNPDDTEDIKRIKVSLEEALQMVMDNDITHGPSCMLILKTASSKNQSNRKPAEKGV